jgi:hypothetical protein
MGDIPVSSVVNVTIGTAPTFPSRQGFGTINIIGPSPVIGALERSRIYNSILGVGADFATNTEEFLAAQVYYGQNPRPRQIVISRRVAAPIGAQLRGGSNSERVLANWTAVTTGSLKLTIGAVTKDVLAISFAAATNLPGVAAILQTAIRAADVSSAFASATVQYKDSRFYLTSGVTGATSTIGYAAVAASGVDISGAFLNWTAATGARPDDGHDTETLVDALTAAQDANQDWFGFAFTKEMRDDPQNLDAAAWAQARVKMFAYDSDDRTNLDPLNDSSLGYQMDQATYDHTMGVFNHTPDGYAAVSAMARAFIVNFNVANSTITLKFKILPGILPEVDLKASEKASLDKIHMNAYYNVGGNPMFGEGFVFGGRFFDEVHGIFWLQNAIETNVFGKLYTDQTKTAMTDPGVASLQGKVEEGLDQGVNNGLLAPGYLPDGTYLQKGYRTEAVKVKDHNQSDKEARIGPPITFDCIGAGAIHGISIVGTFQR